MSVCVWVFQQLLGITSKHYKLFCCEQCLCLLNVQLRRHTRKSGGRIRFQNHITIRNTRMLPQIASCRCGSAFTLWCEPIRGQWLVVNVLWVGGAYEGLYQWMVSARWMCGVAWLWLGSGIAERWKTCCVWKVERTGKRLAKLAKSIHHTTKRISCPKVLVVVITWCVVGWYLFRLVA